jgi:hypothetical protein
MNYWLPASSSLNFLAGIFAGAGINLITSVATDQDGEFSAQIGLDSALWVLAAGFLTWAANRLRRGERDTDLLIAPDFTEGERRKVLELHTRRSLRQARIPLILTTVSLLLAVAGLPRLVHWGSIF